MSFGDIVWSPWETRVNSWTEALQAVDEISDLVGNQMLVWRGVVDASWSMHSSIHRRVVQLATYQPSEAILQRYEVEILRRCRNQWRYDDLTALELMAHIQHFGGPTRLIDVTLNPLIGLWFAVEEKYGIGGTVSAPTDARLFAFAVSNRVDMTTDKDVWGGRDLPWAKWTSKKDPWGRFTTPPRLWVPPAYNERISAQNAGFLIGGTPNTYGGSVWREGPGTNKKPLSIDVVRAASSLNVRPAQLGRKPRSGTFPVYNLRIDAGAKAEIRRRLEDRYGYTTATIYPDLYAMANNVLKTKIV